MVLYPAGFYVGITDAYLAHNLYTNNTTDGYVCVPKEGDLGCDRGPLNSETVAELNVPLPPERRLLVGWFNRICAPGEALHIEGRWTRFTKREGSLRPCPIATALKGESD